MASKLSPAAQQRVALLEQFVPHVGRMNSLVEQYAAAKAGHESINGNIKRLAVQMKIKLMAVGLDQMSQLCGSIEQAAARSSSPGPKARLLRELTGSLKFQLDLQIRTVVREDEELRATKKAAKDAAAEH